MVGEPERCGSGGAEGVNTQVRRAVDRYLDAKHTLLLAGFAPEIDWQASRSFDRVDESAFLREAAWVVLSAGFSEAVLRPRFKDISEAFLHWTSARSICLSADRCARDALAVFGHVRKITAIVDIAEEVSVLGFATLASELQDDPVVRLQAFPYIGPVTSLHLAKNLGFDVAKPDRHLSRIATALRFESAGDLCRAVSTVVGDRLSVVDLVFWRFATLVPDYEERLMD